MRVNTNYYQTTPYVRANMKSNVRNNPKTYSLTQENVKTEYKTEYSSNIWEELAKEYDIRNASFEELHDIAFKLYDTGEISFFDLGVLIFDPSKSPQKVRPNIFLTKANPDGKRDWIAEYEARANMDLKIGNMLGYKSNRRILDILRRLQ
ncbi:hypothetical protein [Thermosediminibacter oceani]|uniref:Uncharacterized protein n=1 Tax=Thermosediminibacter oceani (strain ATCC BAA-1034 / DSM 16646 / JW/IW-1228P) TaxID=555079 RepID=D9RZZ5_THEOJ|nr:hypothetical protein [Thermosediminibacter oceani]ADL08772.1 hypothetical protein Toce_2055 [Thermosediminibacter oceani DSM 16646]